MSHMKALLIEVEKCMGTSKDSDFVGSLVLARLDVSQPWDASNPGFRTLVRNLQYQACPCRSACPGETECPDCGRRGSDLASSAVVRREKLAKGLSGGNGGG
jgi:hypothetical protein